MDGEVDALIADAGDLAEAQRHLAADGDRPDFRVFEIAVELELAAAEFEIQVPIDRCDVLGTGIAQLGEVEGAMADRIGEGAGDVDLGVDGSSDAGGISNHCDDLGELQLIGVDLDHELAWLVEELVKFGKVAGDRYLGAGEAEIAFEKPQ